MSTNSIHSQMQNWLNKHGENINNYSIDEKVDAKQLKQLEDDKNSSTGNV